MSGYVEEAKRWGIAVRLPSVNRSRMEYTVEAGENGAHALRIGLMQVKGLRVETIMAILRMRDEAGAFRSLEDFLHRVTVERDEIQALIKCGAFDEVCNMTRPAMLWRWHFLQAGGQNALSGTAELTENAKTLFATANPHDDIDAALAFAARQADHPIIAASRRMG